MDKNKIEAAPRGKMHELRYIQITKFLSSKTRGLNQSETLHGHELLLLFRGFLIFYEEKQLAVSCGRNANSLECVVMKRQGKWT